MTVSLISAAIPIDESSAAAEVEDFLAHLLRCNDLMFQTDSHRWLLLTPLSELEEHRMLERLQSSLRDANLNRPNRSLPEVVLERIATCSVLDDRETITQHFRRAFEPAMESVAAV